jgi:DNA-binding response OmpR family regulator
MKILVIEDEKALAGSITSQLENEGYLCETAYDYPGGLEKVMLYNYDCVIVDINLPGGDGFSLIEQLKKAASSTGIIIISARNSVDDKVRGLNIGSDDYLVKPFHFSELNARIKSLLRRRNFNGSNDIVFQEIKVDLNTRKVFVKDTEVVLYRKEFDLLLYFLSNRNTVLTKAAIAEHLWGDNIDSADSLDIVYSHIKNLRKKLLEKGTKDYIQSIYGIGYKFGEK